jgi:hypothetical protein
MREAKEQTQDPNWILGHQGYKVLSESAIEYLREHAGTELDIDPNSVGGMRIAGLPLSGKR